MTTQVAINCAKCENLIASPLTADGQTMKDGAPITLAICAVCGPFHCLTCKQRTASINPELYTMGNGHPGSRGICAVCGRKKNRLGALPVLRPAG